MKSVIGQFFRNVFTIYIGMAIGIVITFFLTPYLISELGKEQYGVWQLAFSILGFMRFADVGMKQSIVRHISKHYATGDWDSLNRVYSSSVRVYMFISSVILIATLLIAIFVLEHFQIPKELITVATYVVLFLGLDQVLTYMFIPFTPLGAFHRFDISNSFRVGRQIVQTIGIVILLEMGYGLVAMSIMVFGLNILVQFGMNNLRIRMYPEMAFSQGLIDRKTTRELLNYGFVSFLIVVAWIIIFQTDNIVIGYFISMEAVAVYSVAVALIAQVRGAIGVMATPLVPTISHLEAGEQFTKIRTIYTRSTRYLYYLSGFIAVSIFFYGEPFIVLWVGDQFREAIPIMYILILASAFYLPQSICNSILLGISRHKIAFYILGIEALSNVVLSVILVQSMGIKGVALGTAIPQLIIYIFIYPFAFNRVIRASLGSFYITSFRSLILAVVTLTPAAYLIKKFIVPDGWLMFAVGCVALTLVMLLLMSALVLLKEDRDQILAKIRSMLGRP